VLWLIKGLGPGGAERLLVSLSRAHDREAVDLTVAYVLPWKDALVPELAAAGVDTICLGGRRGALDPRWPFRLRRLMRSGRFDIVHNHSPLPAIVARITARSLSRRNRPIMVTTEHNAWSTFSLPTRVLNAATAPLDDASLAVSEEARSSIWWSGLRDRTEVVVHGVDLTAIDAAHVDRSAARAELGVGDRELLVVTVANYRAQKAWPDLLAAASVVLDADPAVRFAGVGQGPLAAEVEAEHRRLGLGERFALLGRRDDVPRILAAGDLFVLSSTYEGYPVALMEALAAGLPVVATAVGGVAQAITPGTEGLLVPPGDREALAAAILTLCRDESLRTSMAASARIRGRGFDIAEVARRLERLYGSMLRDGA